MCKHTREKLYSCKCNGLKSETVLHILERQYSCNVPISNTLNLKSIVYLLTGETPYSCGSCGSVFSRNLQMHKQTHSSHEAYSDGLVFFLFTNYLISKKSANM